MVDKPTEQPPSSPEPDPIFIKMDQLLAQIEQSAHELRTALFIVAQIPPEQMASNEQRARKSNLISSLMTRVMSGNIGGLMSGRWHRRDGDVYGMLRQPGVPRSDADDQTRDIRPPNQR